MLIQKNVQTGKYLPPCRDQKKPQLNEVLSEFLGCCGFSDREPGSSGPSFLSVCLSFSSPLREHRSPWDLSYFMDGVSHHVGAEN